jgi:hypothetical protein
MKKPGSQMHAAVVFEPISTVVWYSPRKVHGKHEASPMLVLT